MNYRDTAAARKTLQFAAQPSPLQQQQPAVLQSTSAMYPASPPHRLPPARKSHEVPPSFIRSLEIYARYSIAHCIPLIPRNPQAAADAPHRRGGTFQHQASLPTLEITTPRKRLDHRLGQLIAGCSCCVGCRDPIPTATRAFDPPRTPHTTRIVGALHMSVSPPPVDRPHHNLLKRLRNYRVVPPSTRASMGTLFPSAQTLLR